MGQDFSFQRCLASLFPCCFPDEEDLKGKKLVDVLAKELGEEPVTIDESLESDSNIMVNKVDSDEPNRVVEVVPVKVTSPESLKEPSPEPEPIQEHVEVKEVKEEEEKDWVSITDEEVSHAGRNRANTD